MPLEQNTLGRNRRAVGVFSKRQDTEMALRELQAANFPMGKVSVIARDADKQDDLVNEQAGNKAGEGATTGAVTGGALGGITGLLVGLGALAIPGIGPILFAGIEGTAIATTLAGGAIGAAAGGLVGALIGLGIPEERAKVYNERVNRGHYLVIVEGTEEEIRRAEAILSNRGIEEWGIYDAPDRDQAPTTQSTTATPRSTTVPTQRDVSPVGTSRTDYATPQGHIGSYKRAVGVFPRYRDVEAALTQLREAGFVMEHVSVIVKDADSNDKIAGVSTSKDARGTNKDARGNKADEGAKTGAATGGVLGGIGGLLVGLGALAIPGIGPIMTTGALGTALATTLAGGAIGAAAGGLVGALIGLGIPEERAKVYNERVIQGDYLVMVEGTESEIRRAETILSNHGIQEWGIYDAPDITPERTTPSQVNATRQVIEPDTTPNVTRSTSTVVDPGPEVIIVDRRDQTS